MASTTRQAISTAGSDALPPTARVDVAANQVIKRGHLLAFNAAGFAVQFTAALALSSCGIALEDIDTTGLADGAQAIEVTQQVVDIAAGTSGDALSRANIGQPVWGIDNVTVGATSGGGTRSIAGLYMGPAANSKARVWVGPVAFAAATAMLAESTTAIQSTVHVRGVVDSNVATLSAFAGVTGGTPVNGVTYVAGDLVLLVNQTTASQNGPYVVGAVAAGVAPLTRPAWWSTGATINGGATFEVGAEDTAYPGSSWKAFPATNAKVVDTDDPTLYPRLVKGVVTLASGVKALGSTQKLWLRSTTVSAILVTRNTAATSTGTTGGYAVPVSTRTAGRIGTAAATITAQAADGTTSASDISTIDWCAINW